MTVCIAARFEGGIVCVSDSAITVGNNRITSTTIKGYDIAEGFAMFCGGLAAAQRVLRLAEKETLLDAIDNEKDDWDGDEDDPDFLLVTPDLRMVTVDSSGSEIQHADWGAIGHGSDSARMLLEALYKPNKSESYVLSTLKTIVTIIQKYDNTVYGPPRHRVCLTKN
jgi:20S proteasome alpha/beta subunit